MTGTTPSSPFMLLPVEIRKLIYGYLFPLGKDTVDFKHNYNHKGNIQWVEGNLRLRLDGVSCYTAILAVNRQIYAEAYQFLYRRTFTITVTAGSIQFLGKHWLSSSLCYQLFPKSFPFDTIKALRISIVKMPQKQRVSPYAPDHWADFQEKLCKLTDTLFELSKAKNFSLKSLVIEARALCILCEPSLGYYEVPKGIRYLLDRFRCLENVQDCELRLGCWANFLTDDAIMNLTKDSWQVMRLNHLAKDSAMEPEFTIISPHPSRKN